MVDRKNVISTMLQSFVALGVISVVWVVVGFSLCFGDSLGGIIGNPLTFLNFRNVGASPHPEIGGRLPFPLFALFQLKFAIITPALFTGSMAGRIRFRSYILFMVLFTLFIYAPLAHMTWHPDGLLMNLGVLDFAGGTVVHMSAGFAALAGAVHLGPRNTDRLEHANIPFIILGTGLLWFGWFGFNAGSALGANDDAVLALANTHFASAAGMITWMFYERFRGRKMNAVGACIGAIVGLVAITPAAGFVTIQESVAIGFIAALVSNWAIAKQSKSGLDDTLDVFPSHGVGGMVGMVLTGVFAADVGLTSGQTDNLHVAHGCARGRGRLHLRSEPPPLQAGRPGHSAARDRLAGDPRPRRKPARGEVGLNPPSTLDNRWQNALRTSGYGRYLCPESAVDLRTRMGRHRHPESISLCLISIRSD